MDNTFNLHLPIYPLPNEILKMDNNETICKYCGVSYLIHSEVKKLKEAIQVCFHLFSWYYVPDVDKFESDQEETSKPR